MNVISNFKHNICEYFRGDDESLELDNNDIVSCNQEGKLKKKKKKKKKKSRSKANTKEMSSLTLEMAENNHHEEDEEDEELDMSTLLTTRKKEQTSSAVSAPSKTTRKSISFVHPVATVMVPQPKEHLSEHEATDHHTPTDDANGMIPASAQKFKTKKNEKKTPFAEIPAVTIPTKVKPVDHEADEETARNEVTRPTPTLVVNTIMPEEEPKQHPPASLSYLSPTRPLNEKLVEAVSHPRFDSALNGLISWMKLYHGRPEIDTLFTSEALPHLFERICTTAPHNALVYENLSQFFKTVMMDSSSSGDHLMVDSQVKCFIQYLVKTTEHIRILAKNEQMQVPFKIISKRFSDILRTYRRKTTQYRSQQHSITEMEMKLKQNHSRQKIAERATDGTEDIRALFHLRDLKSEYLDLMLLKQKETKERVSPEATTEVDDKELLLSHFQLAQSSIGNISTAVEDAKTLVNQVENGLNGLKSKCSAAAEPYKRMKDTNSQKIGELQLQRDTLAQKMQVLDQSIDVLLASQDELDTNIAQATRSYNEEINQLNLKYSDNVSLIQSFEASEALVRDFHMLDAELVSLSSPYPLEQQQLTSGHYYLDHVFLAIESYIFAESKCLYFVKNRSARAQTRLNDIEKELCDLKDFAAPTVTKELESNAMTIKSEIDEDDACYQNLMVKCRHAAETFKYMLTAHPSTSCPIELQPYGTRILKVKQIFENHGCSKNWDLPQVYLQNFNRVNGLPLPGHIRPPTHHETTMTPIITTMKATSDSVTLSPSSPPMTAQAVQMPKLNWAKNSLASIQAQKSFTEIQAEEAMKEKNSLKTA